MTFGCGHFECDANRLGAVKCSLVKHQMATESCAQHHSINRKERGEAEVAAATTSCRSSWLCSEGGSA